ncbi:hypothetical protein [Brucella intermedia]|uniref:hypothetical protein n=1 Tax=Brucella intermedia TaxID=94625 RepID=UPI00165D06D4|nr:hypothetical protein [Brucella intermedia]QNQ40054.1 hypothetical protein IAR37_12000 [Brucella intermedia]
MSKVEALLDQLAEATAESDDYAELPPALAKDARLHVWDAHYANPDQRARLDAKLAASSPEFQAAVAVTETALAEELAANNERRARVRRENPSYFKD